MQKPVLSRRDFLKNASVASGLLILPSGFLRGADAPSNRINVAGIGIGGMGAGDLNGISKCPGVKIVGLCDVEERRLVGANKRYKEAKTFTDYREMLDKIGKDIDAVSVSTPDHTHFTAAYSAVALGKHVYVQKPLCHTIDQVRRLTALSLEKKVVTQMGNQGASSDHTRKAKEWYEAGLLGDVSLAESWSDRPIWPQGQKEYRASEPVPAGLKWDLWLGPAKKRPYIPGLHPFSWRGYYDFGCGALGDMAIHLMFDAFYVLDLTAPTKIEVNVSGKSEIAYPKASTVTYYFPGNNKRGPVKFVWYDGRRKPATPTGAQGLGSNGCLLHGKEFTLSVSGWGGAFEAYVPKEKLAKLEEKAPKEVYPRLRGRHYLNWIEGIRENKLPSSRFAYSGPFAEVILLGVIAQRVGRTLNWDSKAGKFINDDEANAFIKATSADGGFFA
ncbi:MAG: Gfo/Idh/MocA family oxidoreductase [Puniceicoccales bacterium]|jgi:predicted dehydrogenase|nr:Gfo/Idh/MocA family oxidoreductase [Puniceicoccales bacterium]